MAISEKMRELIREAKSAYQMAFEGAHGARVMEDLKQYCHAEESTFHADARVHALFEGRRQVYFRIQKHLNYPEEQLIELYNLIIPDAEGEQENA